MTPDQDPYGLQSKSVQELADRLISSSETGNYNDYIPSLLREAARRLSLQTVTNATDSTDLPQTANCWCETCRPVTIDDARMVTCPDCGDKRCPRAEDHRNACTGHLKAKPDSTGKALVNPTYKMQTITPEIRQKLIGMRILAANSKAKVCVCTELRECDTHFDRFAYFPVIED